MRWKPKKDYIEPHLWFAWYPIYTWGREWVWLERVWRHDISMLDGRGRLWEYHASEDEGEVRRIAEMVRLLNSESDPTPDHDVPVRPEGATE